MAIHITTVTDLQNVNNNTTADYVLDNDLDLSGVQNWLPIGYGDLQFPELGTPGIFTGTFDGQGHTISNLTCVSSNTHNADCAGLFGFIGNNRNNDPGNPPIRNGSVANLNIKNVNLSGNYALGGLVGFIIGAEISNVKIDQVLVAPSGLFASSIGGLGGDCYNIDGLVTSLSDCSVNDFIINCIGGESYVGGLLGDCFVSADASGFVFDNCYANNVDIVGIDGSGIGPVGGLIGYANGTFSECYSSGNITNVNFDAGGFIGEAEIIKISNCYSRVNILGDTNSSKSIGGFIGYAQIGASDSISNCYSSGVISGTDLSSQFGGFIGTTYGNNPSALTLQNCYSVGNVESSATQSGGVIGYLSENVINNDTFTKISSINPSVFGAKIARKGNVLFMAAGDNLGYQAIVSIDISSPSIPSILQSLSFQPQLLQVNNGDIALSGNYAYLSGEDSTGRYGFIVIDITNSSSMSYVTFERFPEPYSSSTQGGIDIENNFIYIGNPSVVLPYVDIFDISTPTAPSYVSSINLISYGAGDNVCAVRARGNYLYVYVFDSILVFDITTPSMPILSTTISNGSYGGALIGGPTVFQNAQMEIVSNTLYLLTNLGLEIIDISNPLIPSHIGSYSSTILYSFSVGINEVIFTTLEYSPNNNSLNKLDITTPSMPVLKNILNNSSFPGSFFGFPFCNDVDIYLSIGNNEFATYNEISLPPTIWPVYNINNCSWLTGSSTNAIGYFDSIMGAISTLTSQGWGTDETDHAKFYSKNHAVYDQNGSNPWGFFN